MTLNTVLPSNSNWIFKYLFKFVSYIRKQQQEPVKISFLLLPPCCFLLWYGVTNGYLLNVTYQLCRHPLNISCCRPHHFFHKTTINVVNTWNKSSPIIWWWCIRTNRTFMKLSFEKFTQDRGSFLRSNIETWFLILKIIRIIIIVIQVVLCAIWKTANKMQQHISQNLQYIF